MTLYSTPYVNNILCSCGWNKKWYTKKFLCLRKCAFQQKYFVLKFESTYSFPSPLAYILNIVFNSIIFLPFFIFFVHGCVVLPILHCILIVCPFAFYLKLLGNTIHFAIERIPIYDNETFQPSGEFNSPGSFITPYK